MNSRKRLIVNADDFGRSAGVNAGVVYAHESGIVTSASLMVRRAAARDAASYARKNPRLSVGLHLELGEWVFQDGRWELVEQVLGDAEGEMARQLAQFRDLVGTDPTHIDSHQHVHREAEIGAIAARAARNLGVPLRGQDLVVRHLGDFYGQTSTGEPLSDAICVAALVDLLGRLPPGLTELSCHPGIGTDDDFPYGRERAIEVATLCDVRVRMAIDANDIELCSFADISERKPTEARLAGGWNADD